MLPRKAFPKMSPELVFVLNCIRFSEVEKKQMHTLLALILDWDLCLRQAMEHRVFPLVYKTLRTLNNPAVPDYVLQTLRQECRNNALKAVSMTGEMVRVIRMMEDVGIQPLILKGAPLALKLYEDIALRPSVDIDILIKPQEFAKAEKIMEHAGYKRFEPDLSMTERQTKKYFEKHQHFSYIHPERTICVELHWRTYHFGVNGVPTSSDLSTQKVDIGGCLVSVMADEEWLMYLMVHGCNHMWFRLRWLSDIEKFMKKNLNWDKIILIADNHELRLVLHLTLILVNELLVVPFPEPLTHDVTNDQKAWELAYMVINGFRENTDEVSSSKFLCLKEFIQKPAYYVSFRTGWKRKLSYIFSFIISKFQPRDEDFQLISLPDSLYWFYYLIKPFNCVRRRFLIPR